MHAANKTPSLPNVDGQPTKYGGTCRLLLQAIDRYQVPGPSPFLEEPLGWEYSCSSASTTWPLISHCTKHSDPCKFFLHACSISIIVIGHLTRSVTQEPASAAACARGCKRMKKTAERITGYPG